MDLSLEKYCPYCKTGNVINPELIEWQLNNFEGKQPVNEMIKCPMCNGTGIVPTRFGEEILELCKYYNYIED